MAQLLKMSATDYHADPCPEPSLSSSIARTLVMRSPLHAWLKHPKLGGGVNCDSTPEMDRGTLIHALVFGSGFDQIAFIDADNFRTKVAQEKRDEAYATGRTPILSKDRADAAEVANEIHREMARNRIALSGKSEHVAIWQEETAFGPITCRGMMDHIWDDDGVILDLKTCRSAHPDACKSHVYEYGYDIQYAAYTSALRKLNPRIAGREDFIWVFAEELPKGSKKRVCLTFARPDGSMRELGRQRWSQACETWARCLRDNDWPGYSPEPINLEAPMWAMKEAVTA